MHSQRLSRAALHCASQVSDSFLDHFYQTSHTLILALGREIGLEYTLGNRALPFWTCDSD